MSRIPRARRAHVLALLAIAIGAAHAGAADSRGPEDGPSVVRVLLAGADATRPLLAASFAGGPNDRILTEQDIIDAAAKKHLDLTALPEGALVRFNDFIRAADVARAKELCASDADRDFVAQAIEPRIDELSRLRAENRLVFTARIDLGDASLLLGGLVPVAGGGPLRPTVPTLVRKTAAGYRVSFDAAINSTFLQILSASDRYDGVLRKGDVSRLAAIPAQVLGDLRIAPAAGRADLTVYADTVRFAAPVAVAAGDGGIPELSFMRAIVIAYRDGDAATIAAAIDAEHSGLPMADDKFGWAKASAGVTAHGIQRFADGAAVFFSNGAGQPMRLFWISNRGATPKFSTAPYFDVEFPDLAVLYGHRDWIALLASTVAH